MTHIKVWVLKNASQKAFLKLWLGIPLHAPSYVQTTECKIHAAPKMYRPEGRVASALHTQRAEPKPVTEPNPGFEKGPGQYNIMTEKFLYGATIFLFDMK